MSVHFEWTQDMTVGENTIDAQHRKLLSQLNTVIDLMVFGATPKEIAEAVGFFERYINEHLAYEEEYMKRRGFTEIEEHKGKHQDFRTKYAEFKDKLNDGSTSTAILVEMEAFLGRWWIEHIGHEDKKYYLALGAAE